MEILPGIYQLKVPIPENSLAWLNAYVIRSGRESILIDTGWNDDKSYQSLVQQLEEIGVSFNDLKYPVRFYERTQRVLFSGDHVLLNITPNVSMERPSASNPLASYLKSLQGLENLPTNIVLPAHGEAFSDLTKRVREIQQHHKERMQAILAVFNSEPRTAYQIAPSIPWSTNGVSWIDLPSFLKRTTVTETLAHLELLHAEGALTKTLKDGIITWEKSKKTP